MKVKRKRLKNITINSISEVAEKINIFFTPVLSVIGPGAEI
jgi:hypothetical protein